MATPKEYETTTGTARHALQLLDAGSDDLTVGVTLMDANFPHKTAKIGQLIRRERHADVYSVLDPENDSAYSGHEARAFVLDGIPRKLKRYRKRCVKRFHGRSLLEAPFRGAMVIVYATDLMIRYDDVDKDEVLGSYASDETNYSTSKSLILKDSVVVKGFATLSLHDPRHVNCPDRTGIVDRILPQDMKNESAKVEDLPKLPGQYDNKFESHMELNEYIDLADTTRYKQEVSRIRQLERRRAKRKRKASTINKLAEQKLY
ncbi:hypothetical protein NW762_008920 [Fusarium torreyae]|uniref:Uncharacterized protein n=1 Tax=Fusarium torreyae TaxID=1237075 RepID=A0A9W8RXC4_9HYPO|nr:hypothetical protein NW762_008920 [Fusarium torreyae]